MKKQMIKLMTAVALILGIAIQSNAQSSNSHGANMTPDQKVDMRLNKMKENLNLTDAQVPQVKSILVEQEKAQAANPNDREANHAKMTQELSKVLTADQMNKLKEMQAQNKGKNHPQATPQSTK